MHILRSRILGAIAALVGAATFAIYPTHASGQMRSIQVGETWSLTGMAQVFPVLTIGNPGGGDGDPFRRTGWYLTQPAVMANLQSGSRKLVLRTTLNFEGVSLDEGELTFGGWGEGFIDKRHPHTLLHELMLSVNAWESDAGSFSLSAGKGFAPFGTDDPMARPGLKYPTNHHLSQILERWTVNGAWLRGGWSLEAGVFGGTEPDGPYDFSNIESFGDSWSARVARRWGAGEGTLAEWEASASFGRVVESHDDEEEVTRLWNVALRRAADVGGGRLYALVEASQNDPDGHDGDFSVLAETRLSTSNHQPYARIEFATRPEYPREGPPGSAEFFRYDHDAEPLGATRWLITTAAYAYQATPNPWSLRPFVEVQHHRVRAERGGILPDELFGTSSFWSISAGARFYLGGDPMRMGSYGVLDAMTTMGRSMPGMDGMHNMHDMHEVHRDGRP